MASPALPASTIASSPIAPSVVAPSLFATPLPRPAAPQPEISPLSEFPESIEIPELNEAAANVLLSSQFPSDAVPGSVGKTNQCVRRRIRWSRCRRRGHHVLVAVQSKLWTEWTCNRIRKRDTDCAFCGRTSNTTAWPRRPGSGAIQRRLLMPQVCRLWLKPFAMSG